MAEAKIYIVGKDRKVGAMVKALAREIAGFQPVRAPPLAKDDPFILIRSNPQDAQLIGWLSVTWGFRR